MPTYVFECRTTGCVSNGKTEEIRLPVSRSDEVCSCYVCGQPMKKLIQPVGIAFRGPTTGKNNTCIWPLIDLQYFHMKARTVLVMMGLALCAQQSPGWWILGPLAVIVVVGIATKKPSYPSPVYGTALCLNDSTILVGTIPEHTALLEEVRRQLDAWTKEPAPNWSRRPGLNFRTETYRIVMPDETFDVSALVETQKKQWGHA